MSNSYPPFSQAKSSPLPLVFAGGAFALAAYLVLDRVGTFDPAPATNPRPVTARGELAPLEQSFVAIFDQAAPSIAHINTQSLVANNLGSVRRQQGSGSGFVWDAAGIVVTNDHVVRGARKVEVTVAGRNYSARVLSSSPDHDLAVLQLQGPLGAPPPPPPSPSIIAARFILRTAALTAIHTSGMAAPSATSGATGNAPVPAVAFAAYPSTPSE